ncbi:tRNA (guanine-N(7)-)-methyltransferase non-catalytic subunit WDR4-like [Asterias rubens]|uniref:tRNA (guanine-N(7)-)-methyltransferase non-catalytic subunit WDR4-like n=1 Tax=Asterias rubens TaxID=7604 RepID=UPI0014550C7B|nr:tRNA (guanine-N(7)-)-methyltransferase non-catalytic subunit WDR4-like [Asterias rubens]XP_033628732.1 tRNA (guanine-N(7)-)-methyltransferase non-catalytic subunit WDR4-like [Asterias rubens]XP_033628733.1 tRNA (guanine-N(7)-)-methyltransferase non-catalytic subunit WDR4-like [Asterias rubens]
MARLLWSSENAVCISDSSFVVVCNGSSSNPVYKETRRKPEAVQQSDTNKASSTEEQKPPKVPRGDQGQTDSDPSHFPTGRILASRFSPNGKYFALCDDFKTLSLYSVDGWNLLSTRMTPKRCMSLAFSNSENELYVADKFGDVYCFSVLEPEQEGCLKLGHLSMLLDMEVSKDDKFILTSDRDEKIRVSCLPNAYNIHAFCLGHTEFVSRIAIMPGFDNVLVSGGGDSTLRFWDYVQGRQLHCEPLQSPDVSHDDESQPQIITGIACCEKHGLVAVTLLGSPGILMFHIERSGGSVSVKRLSTINVEAVCWSVCFDVLDRLWVIRQLETETVITYAIQESSEGATLQRFATSEKVSSYLNSDWSFFKSALDTPSPYANLYKRSFDNTKAYMERKQQRIQEQQEKKSSKSKTPRSPLEKRAKLDMDTKTAESGS